MKTRELVYQLANMRGVTHTTLNPRGPGTVRIHLIPPKLSFKEVRPSVVILNGQDIIPINLSWAILLNEFIKEINFYEGREISDLALRAIVQSTVIKVQERVYPKTLKKQLLEDLQKIVDTLCDIAYGKTPSQDIGYMTIGEYAPSMKAPHRMDLMVSAMTKNGAWHCNQKCLHCYAAGQPKAELQEMSTQEWKSVIDKCKKIGIPQLTFTGGEPTMRKDLVEIIGHAKWFVTRLNTNGVRLTPELCAKLYSVSLDSVQITLYSARKEAHNSLVGINGFNATKQGIQNALDAGLNVSINTPLCRVNEDYTKTLQMLYDMGVQYVSCSGLITTGNACSQNSKSTELSEDELYSILESATKFCAEHKMEISFTSPGLVSEERLKKLGLTVPTCGACLSNMAIAPDGTVVPCQSWLSDDTKLGNILLDPWSKIWNSKQCKEIRKFSSATTCRCPLRNKEEAR